MRLYDQLRANNAVAYDERLDAEMAHLTTVALAATRVEITNVADYAAAHYDVLQVEDAPVQVSPWPTAWMEFTFPKDTHPIFKRRAGLVEQVALESGAHLQVITVFLGAAQADRRPVAIGYDLRVLAPNGERYATGGPMPITPDESANITAMGWKVPPSRDLCAVGTFVPKATSDAPRDDVVRNMQEHIGTTVGIISLAMTFAHCKNVAIQEHHAPHKVAAKRAKAGKPPITSYKTLLIDPMREVLKTEGNVEKNGLKKALHICRGHFATYTDDKPLFGRVTGTFWKPMHVRGSKERGEVKKDYVIGAPNP